MVLTESLAISSLELSPLEALLSEANSSESSWHDSHLLNLAVQIRHNLQYQHRWTQIQLHTHSPITGNPLPRPLISGLPPRRLYVHPDEQVDMLKQESERKRRKKQQQQQQEKAQPEDGSDSEFEVLEPLPEFEWVFPSHLREEWSLARFGELFDAITSLPPVQADAAHTPEYQEMAKSKWRETKRALMSIVQDDSTVVYYFVHDGIVKPRQN